MDFLEGYGTPAAHYAEDGPYHCSDCIFATDRNEDKKTAQCTHPKVIQDAIAGKLKILSSGRAEIDLKHGCCTFVLPKEAVKRFTDQASMEDVIKGINSDD